MSSVYLEQIRLKRESKSYTDSLYAVLTAAHIFSGPKYMLAGLSGMAFKFSVHEQLLPMSVSAYGEWGNEHRSGVDNLGVFTEWDAGRTRHPTFLRYQDDAVRSVKSSLDRGIGVIYWIPEFGVICGYDDEDQVFYVKDGFCEEDQIVLYNNFGLNLTPYWYVQIFGERVKVAIETMALESLRLAIHDWETPCKTLPYTNIASGKLAHAFLRRALEQGDFSENGAVYILDDYLCSRTEIRNYLQTVCGSWPEPELNEACHLYKQLVHQVSNISDCMEEKEGIRRVDRKCIRDLNGLLTAAELLEEQAVSLFRTVSGKYPDPRRSTVPRWGSHSPR